MKKKREQDKLTQKREREREKKRESEGQDERKNLERVRYKE